MRGRISPKYLVSRFGIIQKLRREGSNLRPSGYEPDELPLLYFAMWDAKVSGAG